MKLFLLVAVAAAAAGSASALTISSASIVGGGNGADIARPIVPGETFSLRCDLQLNANEEMTYCKWEHIIEGYYDPSTNQEIKSVCTATADDSGRTCTNKGANQLDAFATRITFDVGSNYCGIRVSTSNSYDDGRWECHVDSSSGAKQYAAVKVHAANTTKPIITTFQTTPGGSSSSGNSGKITYNTKSEYPIIASCYANYGKPIPNLRWYVNDERYEIPRTELSSNKTRQSVEYTEDTIVWRPTVDTLCSKYMISADVCRKSNKKDFSPFSFNLICRVDQGTTYFVTDNKNNEYKIIVETRSEKNGSWSLVSSPLVLLVAIAAGIFSASS